MRAALVLVLLFAGCKPTTAAETSDAATSPQANAMPAPLANAPSTAASAFTSDSGPPPVPLRPDVALDTDAIGREGVGYTFSATFRPADVGGPMRAPEVNVAGLDAARKKTDLRLAIEVAGSRMRVALVGHGFVLPPETEIRARGDRYGHVVVWPGGAMYRTLPPGSLRALLGERRFDVAPIAGAQVLPKDEQGKRISIKTRKVDVSTRAAKAAFELGRLPDLGDGGLLLCRMLLDLMNAPPQVAVCANDEIPMRVDFQWTAKGSLAFEITGVLKRTDVAPPSVPPQNATFATAPFPVSGVQLLLAPSEITAFRNGNPEPPLGPGDGLSVANTSEELRLLFVDGVAVAWAAPQARDLLHGFPRGRYVTQWRTFLGDGFDAPTPQSVPSPAPDAGVK